MSAGIVIACVVLLWTGVRLLGTFVYDGPCEVMCFDCMQC